MTKLKQNYTLMEVLLVIAIIAILAGLLFPVIGSSREKAVETQAVAGANSIAMALRNYKMAYQKFPVSISDPVGGTAGAGAATFASLNDYDKIIFSLSGVLPGGGNANDTKVKFKELNRKRTAFLELPPEYMKTGGFFANPWGRRYYIFYGNAKPLEFKRPVNGSLGSETIKIGAEVAVFSELNPSKAYFKDGSRLATSWNGIVEF